MQGSSEVLEMYPDLARYFLGLVSGDGSSNPIKDTVWIYSSGR